jgi:hypothetical protein
MRRLVLGQGLFRSEESRRALMRATSEAVARYRKVWEAGKGMPPTSLEARAQVLDMLGTLERCKIENDRRAEIMESLEKRRATLTAFQILEIMFGVVLNAMYRPEWGRLAEEVGEIRLDEIRRPGATVISYVFPHVELEFPPPVVIQDTHQSSMVPISVTRISIFTGYDTAGFAVQGGFHGGDFFDVSLPVFHDIADGVGFANRGPQKIETHGLAHHQNELPVLDLGVGSFLHAERRYAKGLDRGRHAGNRGHGCGHADVIGLAKTAPDPDAGPSPGHAVIGGAPGHGQIRVPVRFRGCRIRSGGAPGIQDAGQ